MIRVVISGNSRYPMARKQIKRLVVTTLKKQGIEDQVEVSLSLVGDRKMKQLNQEFRGCQETTDVLSFPLRETTKGSTEEEREFMEIPDDWWYLGDVVISYPQALKQAQEHNLLVDEEIDRLVEHGVLHLLGIHHE